MSDPNAILDSAFPRLEVAKAAQVADGAEMVNRTQGKSGGSGSAGETRGRPRKSGPKLHLNPENPLLTSIVSKDDEGHKWEAGSVLQVLFANGQTRSVVLLHNIEIAPLDME
ncbi:hypothetical protein [Blastopirellula marina]|uniref:Uncharacterized protein n=1 Tax=Blastopirellula marina DSM 3645 TaxID=314230 RepID=A3ZPR2_9BACT|nr:hypothetical protein [Blastopirellula marina]EAQ81740.1 hypothetical protein DSM3645_29202 [Blastopirellula marina DSM 3645]